MPIADEAMAQNMNVSASSPTPVDVASRANRPRSAVTCFIRTSTYELRNCPARYPTTLASTICATGPTTLSNAAWFS